MNEMSKKSNQGQVIESKITEEKAEKLWKFWERNGNTSAFAAICLAFVLLCIGIFQIFDTGILIGKAAKNAYQKTYSEVSEAKQQEYYQQAYNNAENTHHVSNKITISIGDIQKKQNLEVLKVSNVTYITENDVVEDEAAKSIWGSVTDLFQGDTISWLEVSGESIFTVNMKESEFVIDSERRYVLARIPHPVLGDFTIDKIEPLFVEDTGVARKSASTGVDLADKRVKFAEQVLKKEAESDQFFYESAEKAAETILENLVKGFNHDIPDLTVEVEFID